jgi:hypothetical protein
VVSVCRDERGPHAWVCLGLWLGLQFVLPAGLAAQTVTGAARVITSLDACVPVEIEQFQRVLAIELGTSIEFSRYAAQEPDGTVVRISCRGRDIELQLKDNLTRKSMTRRVELPQGAVAARTRLLALAVAEFVVASWVELQLARPALDPVGPPVPPEAAEEARAVAQARLPAPAAVASGPVAPLQRAPAYSTLWLLGASLEGVAFVRSGGLLGQLSVDGEQRPAEHLALSLSVGVARGSWTVRWSSAAEAIAHIQSTSVRLSLGYVSKIGAIDVLAAAAVRFGLVHMAGESRHYELRAVELYAPWGGPAVHFAGAYRLDHLRLGLALEVGYVTLPVQALIGNSIVADFSGAWAQLGLTAAWLF